ncbi:MAG TPA: hypothetical protein VER55_01720 [Ardenticatenaceae bacterium]|nr:hypothetical protein [Ardenticatenaceae bacterium]
MANAYVLEGENGIYYFACDGDCGESANWQRAFLFERGQGSSVGWDIALDARNRPRIAFYQGSLESEGGDQLYYAWCDEACLDLANWERVPVGLPEQDGQAPDLELDGRGRPRIAYVEWIGSLGYAWCDRGCESERGGWESVTVESSEALQQLWPIAHPTHCDAGLWNAVTPTLALDRRGNPRIAYDATYHARCWYDDELDAWEASSTFHLMWRVARGISFSQPS